ncbi:hypothetical protein, partial [Xanthomonas hortorum]|uniref:hypothetical protein n=1 Tax=Xanthomonas hortorum TaxID=56454 RepID=UPI001E4FEFF3
SSAGSWLLRQVMSVITAWAHPASATQDLANVGFRQFLAEFDRSRLLIAAQVAHACVLKSAAVCRAFLHDDYLTISQGFSSGWSGQNRDCHLARNHPQIDLSW